MILQTLAEKLKHRQLTLATAESCTGGMIAARCTDLPGSSMWFDRACVTYSNQAKQSMLGVTTETLEQCGAVSEACVQEMLAGLLCIADIGAGIAVSGVAGPDGGSIEKPIGTVWFAIGVKDQSTATFLQHFPGDRQAVREQACTFALEKLLEML